MADNEKPKPPAPFVAVDENQWESELANWDASLPIEDASAVDTAPAVVVNDPLDAIVEDDGSFDDTPITLVTAASLNEDAHAFEAAAAEFSERASPNSEIYAALVSSVESTENLFRREPPIEPPAWIVAEPLPEMAGDPWRERLDLLISVPSQGAPVTPTADERRASLALLASEMEVADTATHQAALTLAAARITGSLGDIEAAIALCDDALTLQPGSPAALRARLRLAEGQGDTMGALEIVARLGAALAGDEGERYRAVHAEWTLALTGTLDAEALGHLGDGFGRMLAEAEIAVRQGNPRQAGAALEPAAAALGGAGGAGLARAAARLAELGGDFAGAARQRVLAASLAPPGPERLLAALGQLRDAARGDPAAAEALLDDLLPTLPPGDLKISCARWAATLARRSGSPDRAARWLADAAPDPGSPALLRDRIDAAVAATVVSSVGAAGAPVAERLRQHLREGVALWSAPSARACLDLLGAELALRQGDDRRALDIAGTGLAALPGAVPLAMIAERIGRATPDPALRLEALRVWARFDAARAAYAWSLIVDTLTAAAGPSALVDASVHQAWADLAQAAPMATAFWTLSARQRAAGHREEAAETLARGAAAWEKSELAPSLLKLADILRADPSLAWPAPVPGRGKSRVADTPESVLAEDPADPAALALVTLTQGGSPERLAAVYALAATGGGPGPDHGQRLWRLQAVHWLARAGRAAEALAAALALHQTDPGWEPARVWAQRLVRVIPDAVQRARRVVDLGFDPGDLGGALRVAEANESLSHAEAQVVTAAAALFRDLGAGLLAAEGQRGLARLEARAAGDSAAEAIDEPRARVRGFLDAARAGRIADLALRLEREPPHQDVATAPSLYLGALLREGAGDAPGAADCARLLAAAMAWRDAPRAADRPGLLCCWRAAELSVVVPRPDAPGATKQTARNGDALAAVADLLARGDANAGLDARGDGDVHGDVDGDIGLSHIAGLAGPIGGGPRGVDLRSSATLLVRAAEQDVAAGDTAAAEARLRTAVERDAFSLPALRALRRLVMARGAFAEAAEACEREAGVLNRHDEKVRVLMLAAELAQAASKDSRPPTKADSKAPSSVDAFDEFEQIEIEDLNPPATPLARLAPVAHPLRQVLALDPGHLGAFQHLREVLSQGGDHAALAALLAARVAVATNPFEIASLRLARAELLAGSLGDLDGAKVELAAVLQKEPQHAKALIRLADLHYDAGAFAEAAELYLKRALAERSPERLREIFLRIGRIYTRHHRDAKRAADAYKRVLQLEGDNREALTALSELLVEVGEAKNAIAVTDRLVELTPEVERRVPYLIRLGQLWEQVGDLRQAGARFRRAADDAPRNLQAVGEMVRHFDRTRDVPGRRALLDHALLLLRADLHAGKLDLEALRAIVHVMQWRGRPAAAAAGAQLLAVWSSDATDRAAVATWAAPPPRGRRLSALSRPDVDERLFLPGLPSGVRNIFRIIGEPLARATGDIKRHELTRADRVARGQGPREIIDPIAAELGLRDVEVYIKPARLAAEPASLAVEPGEPPTLILGTTILTMGAPAIRFAAGRALRLATTHLDLVLRGTPPQTGSLVGGVVRQFVADYVHPDVPSDLMNAGVATVSRVLSRRLRQEVMPFAIESAGGLELAPLHDAVRDGANHVGLLASGNLPVCLAVVLATAGRDLTLAHVAASGEAMALLDFALSDGYDELCREMDGATAPG